MRFKNVIYNIDKLYVGQKCKVLVNSKWFRADTIESNIWLYGRIIKINWGKDDCFKYDYGIPSITIYVYESKKYKTWSLPNLTILPSSLEKQEILKIKI